MIDIDDIEIGAQMAVDVEEHGANKDFLYLKMKCASGLQTWWKLRWAETDKWIQNESEAVH